MVLLLLAEPFALISLLLAIRAVVAAVVEVVVEAVAEAVVVAAGLVIVVGLVIVEAAVAAVVVAVGEEDSNPKTAVVSETSKARRNGLNNFQELIPYSWISL